MATRIPARATHMSKIKEWLEKGSLSDDSAAMTYREEGGSTLVLQHTVDPEAIWLYLDDENVVVVKHWLHDVDGSLRESDALVIEWDESDFWKLLADEIERKIPASEWEPR